MLGECPQDAVHDRWFAHAKHQVPLSNLLAKLSSHSLFVSAVWWALSDMEIVFSPLRAGLLAMLFCGMGKSVFDHRAGLVW
jgi:hypothetical protein